MFKKSEKEKLIKQQGIVIWFTGLSGSGKTTLANALEKRLHKAGYLTQWLDGDKVRKNLNKDLGFTEKEREENIRRVSEVTRLFVNCGIICLNSFITPTEKMRNMARKIIGEANFLEVFIDTPIEICRERDTKGLYQKAYAGVIPDFTGVSSVFEVPENPDITIHSDTSSLEEEVEICMSFIMQRIKM